MMRRVVVIAVLLSAVLSLTAVEAFARGDRQRTQDRDQLCDPIQDQLCTQDCDQLCDPIRDQLRTQDCDPVLDPVRDRDRDRDCDQDQLLEWFWGWGR